MGKRSKDGQPKKITVQADIVNHGGTNYGRAFCSEAGQRTIVALSNGLPTVRATVDGEITASRVICYCCGHTTDGNGRKKVSLTAKETPPHALEVLSNCGIKCLLLL